MTRQQKIDLYFRYVSNGTLSEFFPQLSGEWVEDSREWFDYWDKEDDFDYWD